MLAERRVGLREDLESPALAIITAVTQMVGFAAFSKYSCPPDFKPGGKKKFLAQMHTAVPFALPFKGGEAPCLEYFA